MSARPLWDRLLAGGRWALLGNIAGAIFTLAATALAARLLSPENAGSYFLAISVATAVSVIGQMGLHQSIVRLVAEALADNRPERAWAAIRHSIVIAGAATAAAVALLVSPAGRDGLSELFDAPGLSESVALVAVLAALRVFGILRAEIFRGMQDIRLAMIFSGLDASMLATLLLAVVLATGGGPAALDSVLVLSAIAWVPGLMIGWAIIVRRLGRAAPAAEVTRRAVVGISWPNLVSGAAFFVYSQADLWIVAAFTSPREVALYGAATRLVRLVSAPVTVVNSLVPPFIPELYVRGRRDELERMLSAVTSLAALPALLAIGVLAAMGGLILDATFGSFYRGGATVLAILALGQVANVLTGPCGIALVMTGHERWQMITSVATGVAMAAGALLAVGPFGTTGVAVAVAAALTLQVLAEWTALRLLTGMGPRASLGAAARLARERRGSETT